MEKFGIEGGNYFEHERRVHEGELLAEGAEVVDSKAGVRIDVTEKQIEEGRKTMMSSLEGKHLTDDFEHLFDLLTTHSEFETLSKANEIDTMKSDIAHLARLDLDEPSDLGEIAVLYSSLCRGMESLVTTSAKYAPDTEEGNRAFIAVLEPLIERTKNITLLLKEKDSFDARRAEKQVEKFGGMCAVLRTALTQRILGNQKYSVR